jgi:hypothetical protein
MADTDRQEKASLVAFYYAIENGASLTPYENKDLYDDLKKEYPPLDDSWYKSFLKQTKALIKWMGHKEGSVDTSYKYARWGKSGRSDPTIVIPNTKKTDVFDWIWEEIGNDVRKILFNSRKDNWNTADVYLVKSSEESKIIKNIKDIVFGDTAGYASLDINEKEDFLSMKVGSLNRYLAYLLKNKILIGISLKEANPGEESKVTVTNVDTPLEGIQPSHGKFITKMHTYMDLQKEGSTYDFKGNSLTYQAEFSVNDYAKIFKYESKISSVSADATEPRDRVIGVRGGYTDAPARNGSVPEQRMKKIVKKYTGEEINEMIPLNRDFDDDEKDYWVNYLKRIKSDSTILKDLGGFTYNRKRVSEEELIDKMLFHDKQQKRKDEKRSYSVKLRCKLRCLRYINCYIQAQKNKKLHYLLTEIYLASSKIQMDMEDVQGPFIKIQ